MASPLRLFLLLCIFRVLNVFLIQSYFDPDEFWQTMEPAYCTVFRPSQGFDCPGFTWEWKRRAPDPSASWIEQGLLGPARTYLSVLPTHVFYQVLKTLELDSTWMVGRGPMLLYAITVAAPTDLAVWGCAHRLYPHSSSPAIVAWCLVASLSAWFHAFSLVRTFANGQETVLLMASLVLVSPELLGPRSGPAEQSSGRILRTCGAFLLGGMSVSIRGTAVAAFVPMGILLALQETSWIRKICYLFFPCALFGLLGIGVALLVDYWFFAFPALPFLGNFHFNVLLDNATLFGTHPWHWYFSAGIPAITGVLLPLLIMDLVAGCWSSGRRNLWIIVGTYVVALSMNQHKEFRHILPMLPIFCLLAGERLHTLLGQNKARSFLRSLGLAIFAIANLVAVLYLGIFHQSGPIRVNREILRLATTLYVARPTVRVHYLTGACHSTPLLSALHAPPLRVETRTLDCSPACRADPELLCETERFHMGPLHFLKESFPLTCTEDDPHGTSGSPTCTGDEGEIPTFVVTMSGYVDEIRGYLGNLGLYEVGRYANNLNGARIAGHVLGDDFDQSAHRHLRLTNWMELSVEDVVLLALDPTTP